jgi:hypothetical protein
MTLKSGLMLWNILHWSEFSVKSTRRKAKEGWALFVYFTVLRVNSTKYPAYSLILQRQHKYNIFITEVLLLVDLFGLIYESYL